MYSHSEEGRVDQLELGRWQLATLIAEEAIEGIRETIDPRSGLASSGGVASELSDCQVVPEGFIQARRGVMILSKSVLVSELPYPLGRQIRLEVALN